MAKKYCRVCHELLSAITAFTRKSRNEYGIPYQTKENYRIIGYYCGKCECFFHIPEISVKVCD